MYKTPIRLFSAIMLSGSLLAGACGADSTDGSTDGMNQIPVDEAVGEQLVSADCPSYSWQYRQFGTAAEDEAVAIAADPACNIYVTGNTQGTLTTAEERRQYQDIFVARLPSDRGPGWTHQFGTDSVDIVRSLAVDSNGAVYAVGDVQGSDAARFTAMNTEALGLSVEPDGRLRWQQTYSAGADVFGLAVALKKDEAPLLVGATFADSAASSDLWLAELSPKDGLLGKETQLGTPEYDRPEGVAIDKASGDIFLAGSTAGDMRGPNHGSSDLFLRKHDADHKASWIYQDGTEDVDVALRVVRAPSGSLYVLALSFSDLTNGRSENDGRVSPFVLMFDKDGNWKWTVRLGSGATPTQARGLALGPRGDVYIAGSTSGRIGSGPSKGGWDAFLVKLNGADGALKWTKQFGSSGDDYAAGVVVSPNGRILVSGSTNGSLPGQTSLGFRDGFVVHLSPSGAEF